MVIRYGRQTSRPCIAAGDITCHDIAMSNIIITRLIYALVDDGREDYIATRMRWRRTGCALRPVIPMIIAVIVVRALSVPRRYVGAEFEDVVIR